MEELRAGLWRCLRMHHSMPLFKECGTEARILRALRRDKLAQPTVSRLFLFDFRLSTFDFRPRSVFLPPPPQSSLPPISHRFPDQWQAMHPIDR
jgi:hypothetical protein